MMKRRACLAGLLSLVALSGCGHVTMTREVSRTSFTTSDDQAGAYSKANRIIQHLGWTVVSSTAQAHLETMALSTRVNKAVTVNILFQRQGKETLLDVQGIADAGYILDRSVPAEVDLFIQTYKRGLVM